MIYNFFKKIYDSLCKNISYVLLRLIPIFILILINKNINHNFYLTFIAEIIMLLDDVDLVAYQTTRLFGGTVFAIEKLLSYSSYLSFLSVFSLINSIDISIYTFCLVMIISIILLYYLCVHLPIDNILSFLNIVYMTIVVNWLIILITHNNIYHILGGIIYTITDFDIVFYEAKILGPYLLPIYNFGLLLLCL